jgi:hypothetical protein
MFDCYGLPFKETNVQVFIGQSASNDWFTWRKPRSASMIFFLGISSGAGGGGGASGTGARGGGGGGGPGGILTFLVPACIIPDILYIQALLGGAGGSATTTGSSGTNTYVSISQSTDQDNLIFKVQQTFPSGGQGITGSAGGGAGNVGTSPGLTQQGIWSTLGIYQSINPPNNDGKNGGNSSQDGTNAITHFSITLGGAGGGGTTGTVASNGGNVVGTSPIATIPGGIGNASSGGGNGSSYNSNIPTAFKMGQSLPFFGTAGSGGGGGGTSANGGNGGNGGIGCGGGGGGGGLVGGSGGNGGPGMVAIWTW